MLVVASCDSDTTTNTSPREAGCDDSAAPVFLASKPDADDDDDIADHCWARDDAGMFHLFFQNEGVDGASAIEHYTSRDLGSIDYAGEALAPRAGTWDEDGVWAPHVVRQGDTWLMFYTGVQGSGAERIERIGLATSGDLTHWTRVRQTCADLPGDGCVYECNEPWTTWGTPGDNNQQCRDPFVIRDDAHARWLLFVTARSSNGYGEVAVAESQNLTQWRGVGYIDATRRLAGGAGAQTTGGMAENPFVIAREGMYYLFFTDWWDPEDSVGVASPRTIAQYATATSLAIDSLGSAAWSYRGSIPDPGINAIEIQHFPRGPADGDWLMSASVAYPSSGLLPEHRRQLWLRCVRFNDDGTFATGNPRLPPPGLVR